MFGSGEIEIGDSWTFETRNPHIVLIAVELVKTREWILISKRTSLAPVVSVATPKSVAEEEDARFEAEELGFGRRVLNRELRNLVATILANIDDGKNYGDDSDEKQETGDCYCPGCDFPT